jgi:hypothetical protein
MRFDDGESKYSRYARRAKPQQRRLVIYAVVLVAVLAAMFLLKRGGPGQAAPIVWVPSFDEASAMAMAEDRPLLAFFYVDDNDACVRMARETFGDPAVRTNAAKFVCVRVDARLHPETTQRCLQYEFDYPAVAFLTPAGERLIVSWGARDPKRMLQEMDSAMDAWRRGRLTDSPSLPPRNDEPSRGDLESGHAAEPTAETPEPGAAPGNPADPPRVSD